MHASHVGREPKEHYYVVMGNLDGVIQSARLALSTTGIDQMIHRHAYGTPCDDTCRSVKEYA